MKTVTLFACVALFAGAAGAQVSPAGADRVAPPARPIVFQPLLVWEGKEPTAQGTGFFARGPGGRLVAVTCAHLIDFEGPPLLQAKWLDVRSRDAAAVFDKSLGKPGNAGVTEPKVDLRADYWLLPAEGDAAARAALEFDTRVKPETGERVWFPDKDPNAPLGFSVVEGTVMESEENFVVVQLAHDVKFQSQSGTPILSQRTGKVLGLFSRGGQHNGHSFVVLAPAAALAKAIADAKDQPALKQVIGKPVGTKK
jgi:hypothetical protein